MDCRWAIIDKTSMKNEFHLSLKDTFMNESIDIKAAVSQQI